MSDDEKDNQAKGDPDKGDPKSPPASKPEPTPEPEPTSEPALEQGKVIEDSGTMALSHALKRSFHFVKALVAILALGAVFSCMKQVEPGEQAVILRFGKVVAASDGTTVRQPGIVWALPYPIHEVVKIPVGESRTVRSTVGWLRGLTDEQIDTADETSIGEFMELPPGQHGYTLTTDHNIIHVRATAKYRISNPVDFIFNFEDGAESLTNVLDNAILYASARMKADDALFGGEDVIQTFEETVALRIDTLIDRLNLGVTIENVDVKKIPPLATKLQFEEVQQSEQERSKTINEAKGFSRETLERAVGESNAVISAAIGRSRATVQSVQADAAYFTDQLPHFLANRDLYTKRLMIETMKSSLTNVQDLFFIPQAVSGQSPELRLSLSREPEKPKVIN